MPKTEKIIYIDEIPFKNCNVCGVMKNKLTSFYGGSPRATCKACINAKNKINYATNKEKYYKYVKKTTKKKKRSRKQKKVIRNEEETFPFLKIEKYE